MASFLNKTRPPVYCPGCTHQTIVSQLDKAMVALGLRAEKTVIVTDIGCSGLFDTFFNVHAVHGIHGRALTYASGLKLADPDLTIIVTMGDGGLGIGAAHVFAACRRNLDLTLIVLNNFNFGMTGGQCSPTTPQDAIAGSGFLNQVEWPVDVCSMAKSAGATFVARCSGLNRELSNHIVRGISHNGFAVVETLGICTGRYTKNNRLTPAMLEKLNADMSPAPGVIKENERPEYGARYRSLSQQDKSSTEPVCIEKRVDLSDYCRHEVAIFGSAGMRIVTAGELVCHAGLFAGMNVSMKSEHDITVLRGPSVSEILVSPETIDYTGLESPTLILALSDEGVSRRERVFTRLTPETIVIKEKSVLLPRTQAHVNDIDFKGLRIAKQDWALAALAVMAKTTAVINPDMLILAVESRFTGKSVHEGITLVHEIVNNTEI